MEKSISFFLKCRTAEEITSKLQYLGQSLLKPIKKINDKDTLELSVLAAIPNTVLNKNPASDKILAEMCRLAIKQGNNSNLPLEQVVRWANKLYELCHTRDKPLGPALIYKGVAQIGVKQVELGLNNVSFALSANKFDLEPVDRLLSYWALASAAIFLRDLPLSLEFGKIWLELTEREGMNDEVFRARAFCQVLYLLMGQTENSNQNLYYLKRDVPEKWTNIYRHLVRWTLQPSIKTTKAKRYLAEPYPLFLGLKWIGNDTDDIFCRICNQRRQFANTNNLIQKITKKTNKFIEYVGLVERWGLISPYYEIENVLRKIDKDFLYESILKRMLGKGAFKKVIGEKPDDPEVTICEHSIVLLMDIRDYSTMCSSYPPSEIYEIINPIFRIISEEIEKIGGMLFEFAGDCVIVVFNTFEDILTKTEDILSRVVECFYRLRVYNAMTLNLGRSAVLIGIGINKGPIALGYLGGLIRRHLAILGDTINVAARIETKTKDLPCDFLVSQSVFGENEPEVWKDTLQVNYLFRDMGHHKLKGILKTIRLYALSPILKYWVDFVPMGIVAKPEDNIVYIDTGNTDAFGIIDHHAGSSRIGSACELLVSHPELLLGHIGRSSSPGVNRKDFYNIEFRIHDNPDIDCIATLYTAWELMGVNPREELLKKLAEYVSQIDQGRFPDDANITNSLYGIFIAHQEIASRHFQAKEKNINLLEAGLRVIDSAFYILEKNKWLDFNTVFLSKQNWFLTERDLLKIDFHRYQNDRENGHTYKARVNGLIEKVEGLWLVQPESLLFKHWARSDRKALGAKGYKFLAVNYSTKDKNRYIISVDPDSGTNLNGLGKIFEEHETVKRKKLGQERPTYPIRYPSENSDPWYFGQGHNYTIIDSPRYGTVLTAEEVQNIHNDWIP